MTEPITIRQKVQYDFIEVFELNLRAFGQGNEARVVDALRMNHTVFVPERSLVVTAK
jgi:predicted N-acetyltransferase YhbS